MKLAFHMANFIAKVSTPHPSSHPLCLVVGCLGFFLILTELKILLGLSLCFCPLFPLASFPPFLLCSGSLGEDDCPTETLSSVRGWAVVERRTRREVMSKAGG